MKLYCIDLSKFIKAEFSLLEKQYKMPFDAQELFRLKMSGYNKLYVDEETNKWLFYTLNNAKTDIKLADHLKNIIVDLKSIVQRVIKNETRVIDNAPALTKQPNLSPERFLEEYDRILDKINLKGINSLTKDEQKFLIDFDGD